MNLKYTVLSGLIILLAGCSSAHVNLSNNGQYNGLSKGSLASSIDVLSGESKPLNDDAEYHSPATGLAAEAGIQGGFAAASGFSGASIAFASVASLNTLLSPSYSFARNPYITIVKLDHSEQENSAATFEKVFYQMFDKNTFPSIQVKDIDDNEATISNENIEAYVKKTWVVDPAFVQRILPEVYTGPGKYVAYGLGFTYYKLGTPLPISNITSNTLAQWRDLGWIRSDIKNKKFYNFTYTKNQESGLSVIRGCRFSDKTYNGGKFTMPDRLIMDCNQPEYVLR